MRDERCVYVHELMPRLPRGQHLAYTFETPATRVWHAMLERGELDDLQAAF